MKKTYLVIMISTILVAAGFFYFDNKDNDITGNSIIDTYNKLSPQAKALYYKQSDELTIGCFGPSQVLSMSDDDTNLGGQCCGALKDPKGYELQLESISRFIIEHGNIDIIPRDPYDLSVEHAKFLTSFDKDITLNQAQQEIYDEAMKNSHHGGPCCCKCWKWYVMSGLAKKLIVDYDFSSEDVSELWDISSSCGHSEDTNYREHYDKKEDHNLIKN